MKKILRVFTLMLTLALTLGLLASCTESAKDDASKPDGNSTDVSTDVPVVSVDSVESIIGRNLFPKADEAAEQTFDWNLWNY